MAELETHKEFVGENFCEFYLNSKLTFISFLSTLLVCLLFVVAVTYSVDPYFVFDPRTLGLSIINSLIISYTVVDKKRDFYKRKNEFIDDLKNRNPVYSKDVTEEFHHILTDCLDSNNVVIVKTDVGVVERKVKDIPDRNLKSFSEIFKEIREDLVTSFK
jgi:hypothetical protein